MLKLSLTPLLILSLIACGGETPAKAKSADATVDVTPTPAPSAKEPVASATTTTSAPLPVASASASAAPDQPEEENRLSTYTGYPKELSARIFELYKPKPKCETGWTGSVEIEMKDGKITFWEISGESPDPKIVGKTVPRPPKDLEGFFANRVMVGICAGYIAKM
ncbi:MAG: hypothetical protein HOV80_30125 [Polyangiaceae bacterium]|nr:hypothetical protein [Polyangiaceae bacterium]